MPWLSKRLASLEIVYCICTGWALLFEISLLILTWKRKEEKNSVLVGVSLCINNTKSAHPSFRTCCEGVSERGMTCQWRRLMGSWIQEPFPSKRCREHREEMAGGGQSLKCHLLPRCFTSHFSSFKLISQLCSVAPAFTQNYMSPAVNQRYKWSALSLQLSTVTQILY